MKFKVECPICKEFVWIRGTEDESVGVTELDEDDENWEDACSHLADSHDGVIIDQEYDEDPYED